MSEEYDTTNVQILFGKYKGELWTRVPVSYLNYIVNHFEPESRNYRLALFEMHRRGTRPQTDVEVSGHAVDRASLRLWDMYIKSRQDDEGLMSWIIRQCDEVLELYYGEEKIDHKGIRFVFEYGNVHPILKTIMRKG